MGRCNINVIKRDGKEVQFDAVKISNAISRASRAVDASQQMSKSQIDATTNAVVEKISQYKRAIDVEEIQELVEQEIMRSGAYAVAQAYIRYRYKRTLARQSNTTDNEILAIVEHCNELVKQENANKNPIVNSTQRDYIAGQVSRDISKRLLLPREIVEAHERGILHMHDLDYMVQKMYNCALLNLEDMLQNGTNISGTQIVKPHSFYTACNVATQIIASVASNQYGGQTISLAHLAPFVDVSRQKFRKEVISDAEAVGMTLSDEEVSAIVERRLDREIASGIQTIQYQILTIMSSNGQTPFITVYLYIDEAEEGQTREDMVRITEEMLRQRIKGVQNAEGAWIAPAFPKLVYMLDEDNASEGGKYWSTTVLAAECSAKRMVPDYMSAKKMREYKNGDVYPVMGCRSALTPDRFTEAGFGNVERRKNYVPGKHRYYGRFNCGVCTINLPMIGLMSGGDMRKFWKIFDEHLELCHKGLRIRHERLRGTPSDVAPILWQHGAIARLKPGEVIDPLLFDGYSTLSLGYAGLYELCKYMTGKSHTDPEAKPFALAVMRYMNDKCASWKAMENIDYSLYGTPIESTTYKFAKALQREFGDVPDVSDHNYITNSYHVNVREKINAFDKLAFEAEFQRLSPGGMISYVEIPRMDHNIPAILEIIKFIYNTIMYAELNCKLDYCKKCGLHGQMQIWEDDHHKLRWKCPECGNTDESKMYIVRRVCGYLGSNGFNQGRTAEIRDRVLHLANTELDSDDEV